MSKSGEKDVKLLQEHSFHGNLSTSGEDALIYCLWTHVFNEYFQTYVTGTTSTRSINDDFRLYLLF